jgi:hypothetical protein
VRIERRECQRRGASELAMEGEGKREREEGLG